LKEEPSSSETSVLTRATRRNISEDTILLPLFREDRRRYVLLISYMQEEAKQTPWPLVRKRTIPTDRPPLVDEI
jgi:hypothetical protein